MNPNRTSAVPSNLPLLIGDRAMQLLDDFADAVTDPALCAELEGKSVDDIVRILWREIGPLLDGFCPLSSTEEGSLKSDQLT